MALTMISTQVFSLPKQASTPLNRLRRMLSWAVISHLLRYVIRFCNRLPNWDQLDLGKALSKVLANTTVYGNEQDPKKQIYITIRLLIGSFY
jgi:anti-sigma regulatory factor (Ser/Thr protein kinase)